jgi:hypothetical protein
MKSFIRILVLLFVMLSVNQKLFAQSDIQIFGFFQGSMNKLEGAFSAVADMPAMLGGGKMTLKEASNNYLSVQNQQLNVFFRKEINPSFTAWVNLEVNGSFNSSKNWGSLSLEEAWINFQSSNSFNIKAGLLIPRFAYLNEIKNRMPLLPYITRPLVYEASLSRTIDLTNYVPERAFVQVYGYVPLGEVTFDYAAFVGSSESSYISNNATGGLSVDTTNFKLFGGRVGMKTGELRLGFSTTFDKKNMQSTLKEDVSRTRLALDLGYTVYNFFFDAEYISVKLNSKNTNRDLNKEFYYGTLGYNFTDQIFAYGSYSHVKDMADDVFSAGMTGVIAGLGYKPIDSVVLKAGYSTYFTNTAFPQIIDPRIPAVNTVVDINYKVYQLAVSVLF